MLVPRIGFHVWLIAIGAVLASSCQKRSGRAIQSPVGDARSVSPPADDARQSAGAVRSFDGWCFPANECTGQAQPIKDSRYDTCEETCVMSAPEQVRDMNATSYAVACKGDHGSRPTERMLFFHYAEMGGGERVVVLSKSGVEKLERCTDKPASAKPASP